MSDENELLEPLATEAGQQAIARAINNLSSLEYAVRAERAATTATQKADEASNSADDASDYATEARNWATKTDGYVDQETITIPPEQEGDEPTTETIDLYSARYYAALAQDAYNNLQFDTEPTENSTALVSSGAIYTALNGKADKSDTYTKTEVDTALGNVQSTLTFDSTPTANSSNPVTSGGIYTALQNVNIDIDDEITEDSDNPVTSAAIYEALQNFTPSGGSGGAGNASGVQIEDLYINTSSSNQNNISLSDDWTNYDFVLFKTGMNSQTQLIFSKTKILDMKDNSKSMYFRGGGDSYLDLNIVNNNSFSLKGGSLVLSGVYGIKFSKNLSEQMYSNVLYENSSGTVVNTNITLNDSYKNYDLFAFDVAITNESPTSNNPIVNPILMTKEQLEYGNIGRFSVSGWGSRSTHFIIVDDTTFQCKLTENDQRVYKITGYKLAKGGYSGIVSDARMTIKSGTATLQSSIGSGGLGTIQVAFDSPMPDANYLVFLTKTNSVSGHDRAASFIQEGSKTINGFTIGIYANGWTVSNGLTYDWIAIRPNSYTREGMVEDVLFNTDTPVYTQGEVINLSGNISDYDLIEITTRFTANSGGEPWKYHVKNIFSSQELLDTQSQDKKNLSNTYNNSYIASYCANGDNQIIFRGNVGEMGITKIIGIKFGRYVSGVAVDTTVTQNSDAVVTSGAVYDALQNYTPSGGGSSITVDSTITQGGTNPVEGGAIYTALGDKADKSTTYTKTEVDTALGSKQGTLTFDTTPTANSSNPVTSGGVYTALQNLPTGTGDVTTNTDQNITGTKTFVGSKKVGFKQSAANDKLGFTLFGNTGTERGYLEFNPQNTIDGVAGLMTLGNYATSAGALTHVGFRRYSNISGASGAYNLLMPMVADARTPFSLTTSYTNFYLPLGFTDGTTTVKTAKSGLVDLSPLLASLEARIAALEGN